MCGSCGEYGAGGGVFGWVVCTWAFPRALRVVGVCCYFLPTRSLARSLVRRSCASEETSYINSRPFLVNAGPVHSYLELCDDRTGYLSELTSGKQVAVFDWRGSARKATVGRVKQEKRPLVNVTAVGKESGVRYSVMLQTAETVKLVGPAGGEEGGVRTVGIVDLDRRWSRSLEPIAHRAPRLILTRATRVATSPGECLGPQGGRRGVSVGARRGGEAHRHCYQREHPRILRVINSPSSSSRSRSSWKWRRRKAWPCRRRRCCSASSSSSSPFRFITT